MKNDKERRPTSIRLPEGLEKLIRARADKNERSISKEIIYMLKKFFADENG